MAQTIQQQVARQRRVVKNTPPYPILAHHAAQDKLNFLLAELAAAERQTSNS